MSAESNPYRQPIAEETKQVDQPAKEIATLDFVPIIYRWERLRLFYNAALIVITIVLTLIAVPRNLLDVDFLLMIFAGGLFANLCFFIGPAIEAYGTHFRVWYGWMRAMLFWAGLILTAVLAAVCVLTYPDFNI